MMLQSTWLERQQKKALVDSKNVEFTFNESCASNFKTTKEALLANIFDTVDLKGILSKSDKKQPIIINSNIKYKCDCLVADETGTIKVVLWEEMIEKVQTGKSYHITNLKVRIFDDQKFANTNESTNAHKIEDITNSDREAPEVQENLITGQILTVDLKQTTFCIAYNESLDDNIQQEGMITCPTCKMTTLASVFKTKLMCQVLLKTGDKMTNYTCFTDAIESFLKFANHERAVNDISKKELTKALLNAGTLQMIADKSTRLISQFFTSIIS